MQAITSGVLAQHLASIRYQDLPETTRRAAQRALLDGVAVMAGASGLAEVAPFVELARMHRLERGGARVLGHDFCAPTAFAALANGAMAHALDFEDAFDEAPCHPNASLLPAALAIAEAHGPVSGAQLLTAIAAGCDLTCRIALSLPQPLDRRGWYPPPILGAFGAVAAAGILLGLNARQHLDALSLVLCHNSLPGEIKHDSKTVIRAVREGIPAQLAVTAALLARGGVRGFDAPFEGKGGFYALFAGGDHDPAAFDGLGRDFAIDRLTFKRWPCCRFIHPFLDGLEQLRAQAGFGPGDVAAIRVIGNPLQQSLAEPASRKCRPATAIDAKFSIPFTLAAMLADGDVTLDSFEPQRLGDPALHALADRITFVLDERPGRPMAAGAIAADLADGTSLFADVDHPQGAPERPLSDARVADKAIACFARAACPPPPQAIEAFVNALENFAEAQDAAGVLQAAMKPLAPLDRI